MLTTKLDRYSYDRQDSTIQQAKTKQLTEFNLTEKTTGSKQKSELEKLLPEFE